MSEREYTPTPAEIRSACRKIQKTWSPVVERSRRCGRFRGDKGDTPYEVPVMNFAEILFDRYELHETIGN